MGDDNYNLESLRQHVVVTGMFMNEWHDTIIIDNECLAVV